VRNDDRSDDRQGIAKIELTIVVTNGEILFGVVEGDWELNLPRAKSLT